MNKKSILFLMIVISINTFFNSQFQLHYDEAYYWVFSQNLSLSYYDHPPMLAYLIKIFSFLGHSEFAVRFTSLFLTTIMVLIIFKLAKRMFGQQVADITLLLLLSCPLIEAVFFITTIDTPLLFFWSLVLLCFYVWVFENKTKYIYLAGIFAGFALLSKYTAFLLFPSLLLFLICSKNYRNLLFSKHLYYAFIIALIIFMPVIYWNYQHDWVSFKYQLHHGMGEFKNIVFLSFLDYLGGQVLIGGIIIFLAWLYFVIRYLKENVTNPKLSFLLWNSSFIFIFIAYRSLFQHIEANWPAPMYIAGIILIAYWINFTNSRWVYKSAVVMIIIILIILKLPLMFIPKSLFNNNGIQVVNNFFGTRELMDQAKIFIKPNEVVLACDYGTASHAWFYLNLKRTYVLSNFKFANMYQYWNTKLEQKISHAIYLCEAKDDFLVESLKHDFQTVSLLKIGNYVNQVGERKLYIYDLKN